MGPTKRDKAAKPDKPANALEARPRKLERATLLNRLTSAEVGAEAVVQHVEPVEVGVAVARRPWVCPYSRALSSESTQTSSRFGPSARNYDLDTAKSQLEDHTSSQPTNLITTGLLQ